MVQFLNTAQAYSEIENIISKAEKDLVLISPYLQIPRLLLERLNFASDQRGINIKIVCRKESLKREEFKTLKGISRLDLLNLPNLHAKCFYNEHNMVITSLNLYEYSQMNNREMGLLLTLAEDTEAFEEAKCEAEFIIQTAIREKINKPLIKEQQAQRNWKRHGNSSAPSFGSVLNADVGDSLRTSFPTFSRLLGGKARKATE